MKESINQSINQIAVIPKNHEHIIIMLYKLDAPASKYTSAAAVYVI